VVCVNCEGVVVWGGGGGGRERRYFPSNVDANLLEELLHVYQSILLATNES